MKSRINSLTIRVLSVITLITVNTTASISRVALADSAPVMGEVAVDRVFIPQLGFDDNDNTQAVIVGELPNACFTLGVVSAESNPATRLIRVKQMAWKRTDGVCATGQVPAEPVQFVSEVTIGRLAEGRYAIQTLARNAQLQNHLFIVEKSSIATIDTFNYAPVSTIVSEEVIFDVQEAKITLSGVFANSCTEIEEPIKVQNLGDVIVVLPTMSKLLGTCAPGLYPFKQEVNLGKLLPGRYLIHVRSRGGRAVNRLFFVAKTPSR